MSVPSGCRTLAIIAGLLFPPAAVTTDLLDNIEEPCKNTQRVYWEDKTSFKTSSSTGKR